MPKDEFHQNEKRSAAIKEKAGDLPVIFLDSYQKASKYWFYTGTMSFSLNTHLYRRNNFVFWPVENYLQGNPVYAVISKDSTWFSDTIQNAWGKMRGITIDSFYSHSNIEVDIKGPLTVSGNKLSPCIGKIFVPGKKSEYITLPAPFALVLYVYAKDTVLASCKIIAEPASGLWRLSSLENISLPRGKYIARFAIPSVVPNLPSLNSTVFKLKVQ
jgi:hypothetical protein